MSESHTDVPRGESEAQNSTAGHLGAIENVQELQQTNERPNVKDDRFAPGYNGEDEEKSYLVRCIPDSNGIPWVEVEYYQGLAAVPEYEEYLRKVDSNENANLSTEPSVLLIESIDPWSLVFGKPLDNYPNLRKHIWG